MISTSIMTQYSSLHISILSSSVHLAHSLSSSIQPVQLTSNNSIIYIPTQLYTLSSSVQPTPLTSDNLIYIVIYIVVSVVVLLVVTLLILVFIIMCLRRRKKRQTR